MMNYWLYSGTKEEIEEIYPNINFFGNAKCFYWLDTREDRESVVIWIDPSDERNYSILEHEIFHAVMFTSLERSLDINHNNDETGAYLFQWLHKNLKDEL